MKRAWLVLILFASGCAGAVAERAAFDLQCPQAQIEVTEISAMSAVYGARGCGRQTTYVIRNGQVLMNAPIISVVPPPPASPPSRPVMSPYPPANAPTPPVAAHH